MSKRSLIPCSECPECQKPYRRVYMTTHGRVFCGSPCREAYYKRNLNMEIEKGR